MKLQNRKEDICTSDPFFGTCIAIFRHFGFTIFYHGFVGYLLWYSKMIFFSLFLDLKKLSTRGIREIKPQDGYYNHTGPQPGEPDAKSRGRCRWRVCFAGRRTSWNMGHYCYLRIFPHGAWIWAMGKFIHNIFACQ